MPVCVKLGGVYVLLPRTVRYGRWWRRWSWLMHADVLRWDGGALVVEAQTSENLGGESQISHSPDTSSTASHTHTHTHAHTHTHTHSEVAVVIVDSKHELVLAVPGNG